MSATLMESGAVVERTDVACPSFTAVLHAEWVKLHTVRSTWWTLLATFVLGAGLTILMCWGNADWLASPEADESPGSFITWGMMVAQITAVVLGALVVTTEYGTGMIRTSFAAVPARGKVLAAKSLLVVLVFGIVGTVTALVGYLGGNFFLDREGIGMPLEGDVLRSMYGSGLYLAGIGLFTVAVGFLLRHTAGTISVVLALMLILGNMVNLVPGAVGEWLTKLMPGNAGSSISTPVAFNPNLLDAWAGFGVFVLEIAVLLAAAYVVVRRRDA
ncbi:ABC transporter permease subunit [Nocardioides sp. YIM 152315]|uniref:ABC transporter permease subunit n=1 Tax=Nocardioides sp. YIM 152315 TaxID=3031760 RepID=UPI0023D9EBCD|nr:ABC transporter permease subunit [Nocardioides sp. YIM 152315]MDF1605318.1 ABC transporter permease subunit [Nocardioides sp. YIM 152315]